MAKLEGKKKEKKQKNKKETKNYLHLGFISNLLIIEVNFERQSVCIAGKKYLYQ